MRYVFAALTVALIACATGTALPRADLDSPGGLLFNGYAKSEVNCFQCHNGDGSGTGRGANLKEVIPTISDYEVLTQINNGGKWMPPFKDKLSDAEKEEIVSWLRKRFGGKAL